MKKQFAATFVIGALLALFAPGINAEPYIAVMSGMQCTSCHTNQTGGGKRTLMGNAYAQNALSARRGEKFWDGKVMDFLAIGGNLRASGTYTKVPNQGSASEFDLDEALIFIEVPLIANRFSVYLDQQFAPSSKNREAFALLKFPDQSAYIKAGKFFLPFGWRLEDDTEFVRQAVGINMENPDNGVEAGMQLGRAFLALAVTNGTAGGGEVDSGKQFSLHSSLLIKGWQFGASANFNDAEGAERSAVGGFVGVKTGPVSWLGEIDYIEDDALGPDGRNQLAGFVEGNWWIRQGHNLKLTYGYFDPDDDLDEDERNRYSVVYEYFPQPFTQIRIGFRSNDGIPQSDTQNVDIAFIQLQGYF